MIDANVKRGSAELAVLSLLERGAMHGYEIAKRVEQETAGVLKFDVASLYPLLYRMEKRGWVAAAWQESDAGRRRRCYKLTREGRKQLVPLRQQWKSFFEALNRLGGLANPISENAQ
jgi:PadR family transcriptional regulator